MSQGEFYQIFLYAWFGLSAFVFLLLLFIRAPYGRHNRSGWGLQISSRLGWVLMEGLSAVMMAAFFVLSHRSVGAVSLVFLGMWEIHYVHRAFIYPFRRRDEGKTMPLVVVVMGMLFNAGNCYLNGRYLFSYGPGYSLSYLTTFKFLSGAALFGIGFVINQQSDWILSHLRAPGETGYRIPKGGLFDKVSCPNYLGEILEWTGWALATWSLPGVSFAVWTAANLVPRALAHHRWYREHFDDYPESRKALIPYVL